MATINSTEQSEQLSAARSGWLSRLSELVTRIEAWAQEWDWSTRRIEKRMEDSEVGRYIAPGLILQKETARIMLEPISRQGIGNEGVVDLYLMPAYDDIASLLYSNGDWQLYYLFSGTSAPKEPDEKRPLSKKLMMKILDEMVQNAKWK